MRRIRKLLYVAKPYNYGLHVPAMLDTGVWSPIFARLTKLQIVAEQPLTQKHWVGAASLEYKVVGWCRWFEPNLKYIAEQLSPSVYVEIDHNDMQETKSLVRNYLPNRHFVVHTGEGD